MVMLNRRTTEAVFPTRFSVGMFVLLPQEVVFDDERFEEDEDYRVAIQFLWEIKHCQRVLNAGSPLVLCEEKFTTCKHYRNVVNFVLNPSNSLMRLAFLDLSDRLPAIEEEEEAIVYDHCDSVSDNACLSYNDEEPYRLMRLAFLGLSDRLCSLIEEEQPVFDYDLTGSVSEVSLTYNDEGDDDRCGAKEMIGDVYDLDFEYDDPSTIPPNLFSNVNPMIEVHVYYPEIPSFTWGDIQIPSFTEILSFTDYNPVTLA